MNFLKTFSALILLIILIFIGFYTDPGENNGKTEVEKFLGKFNGTQITNIRFVKNSKEIEIVKKGRRWYLIKPEEFEVNAVYCENFIDRLLNSEIIDEIKDYDIKIREFGFTSENIISYTLKNEDEEFKFQVGTKNPGGAGYYVLKDKKLYLNSLSLRKPGIISVENLRQKHIFSIDSGDISEFRIIKNGSNELELETNNEKIWYMKFKDRFVRANRVRVDDMLVEFVNMEVSEFNRKTDAEKKLENKIIIKTENEEHKIYFENKNGVFSGYYENRDMYFEADSSYGELFDISLEELRARSMMDFNIYNVKGFQIGFPDTAEIKISKRSDNWVYIKANRSYGWINEKSVEVFLLSSATMPVIEYIDSPVPEKINNLFLRPVNTVSIMVNNRETAETILFAKDDNNNPYAFSKSENQIMKLSNAEFEKIIVYINDLLRIAINR